MNKIPYLSYPRPDYRRNDWTDLSGTWQFAFGEEFKNEDKVFSSSSYPRTIEVPFAYQTPMSGINDISYHEILWYRKTFTLPSSMIGKRIFLCFGAVDYEAEVWINNQKLGSHIGGYTPFNFEITKYISDKSITQGENVIVVKVKDDTDTAIPRGKQYWKETPDRCWYTPTSGIWQMVWLEAVEAKPINHIKLEPDIDNNRFIASVTVDEYQKGDRINLIVNYKGITVKEIIASLDGKRTEIVVALKAEDAIDEVHYWTPETPNLYDVTFRLYHEGKSLDTVETYFGMRKVSVDEGRFLLNNRPYFLKMILDQGYWQESGLTPPNIESLCHDIEMTKEYGFNGSRKHQKIEDPRFYYLADVFGLIVWGEVPSAYEFCDQEMENITRDFQEFIKRDGNHPCIVAWVPLNESWGVRKIVTDRRQQEFGKMLYFMAKAYDPGRLVSTNDGWENVESDILSIHDYASTGEEISKKYTKEALEKPEGLFPGGRRLLSYGDKMDANKRMVMVTEYGGIALRTDTSGNNWGYGDSEVDLESVIARFQDVTSAIVNIPGCCGYCYTQLTDVYQEVNGLLDSNHNIKISPDRIRKIIDKS
ncbi:MAG: glycoside hydrolase family 2 protein [Anaerocolumna sp.]